MQVLAFTLGDVPLALRALEVGAIHEPRPADRCLAEALGLTPAAQPRSVSLGSGPAATSLQLGGDLRLLELADDQLAPLPKLLGSPPGVEGILLELEGGRPGFLLGVAALLTLCGPDPS